MFVTKTSSVDFFLDSRRLKKQMLSGFNPCQPCWDTINDKDDFNINSASKNYSINPLETEAERNIRTRTV